VFNSACKIAEAFDLPDIKTVLRRGCLFDVSRRQSSDAWDRHQNAGPEEKYAMVMDFQLPFPATIIQEEPVDAGGEPITTGLWNQVTISLGDIDGVPEGFNYGYQLDFFITTKLAEGFSQYGAAECMITGSYQFVQNDSGDSVVVGVLANHAYYIMPDGELVDFERDPTDKDVVLTRLLVNAISVLTVLNQPTQFIMEITPKRCRPADSPKIPREGDRLHYVLLTPQEIKKRYLPNSNPEHDSTGKRTPHPRRAHWRTFHSDRYVNKKGTRTRIESIWVGESERTVNGVRYRVLLDR